MMIMERKRNRNESMSPFPRLALDNLAKRIAREKRQAYRTKLCQTDLLKMNFSVGVSIYRENVTSYWYRLRCSQRRRVEV